MTAKVIQGWFLGGQPKLPPPVQPKLPPPIQAKTAARSPGRPAPAFVRHPPGPPAPAFAVRPGAVQRHGSGGAFAVEAGQLGLALGGGRPLPEALRGKMEAALGANFADVRVHIGPQAERIGAIAFTVGSDIYFAPGRFQPDTVHGQQLLGHELAHVVQQRAGRVRNPLGSGLAVVQDKALEAEADRLGQRAAAHRVKVQAKMAAGAHVMQQRQGRVCNRAGVGLAVVQDRTSKVEVDRLGQCAATHPGVVQGRVLLLATGGPQRHPAVARRMGSNQALQREVSAVPTRYQQRKSILSQRVLQCDFFERIGAYVVWVKDSAYTRHQNLTEQVLRQAIADFAFGDAVTGAYNGNQIDGLRIQSGGVNLVVNIYPAGPYPPIVEVFHSDMGNRGYREENMAITKRRYDDSDKGKDYGKFDISNNFGF